MQTWRLVVVLAVLTGAYSEAFDYPQPVEIWRSKYPGAVVVGWRQYPLLQSGASLWRIKNDSHYVVVNDDGEEVTPEEVVEEDKLYRISVRGALTDRLAELMIANPGGTFLVSISPRRFFPTLPTPTNAVDLESHTSAIRASVADSLAPIVAALAQADADALFVSQSAPFVFANLNVAQLNTIKNNPDIDVIEGETHLATNFGNIFHAARAMRYSPMQSISSGQGQTVVIVESGRLRSGPTDPAEPHNLMWQSGVSIGLNMNQFNNCGTFDDHASWVAGNVTAFDPNYPGDVAGAPAARVTSANTCWLPGQDDSLLSRYSSTDYVTTLGIDSVDAYHPSGEHPFIINHSYGDDFGWQLWGGGGWMRAIDFRVRNLVQTEVVACGNNGNVTQSLPNGGGVSCRGYNSINVGAFDDKGTPSWIDDNYFKRYPGMNPIVEKTGTWWNAFGTGSDRELPELVASGVLLKSTEQSDSYGPTEGRYELSFNTPSGTSFAAPAVSGLVAMIHGLDEDYKYFPLRTKALLLATSVNAVRGDMPPDFGTNKVGGMYTDADDKRIGVGGVSGLAVADVMSGVRGGAIRADTVPQFWAPGTAGWMWLTTIDGVSSFGPTISTSRARVRVALTWYGISSCRLCIFQQPTENAALWGEYWQAPPDLDLEIFDRDGVSVAQSISFDNSYEVVDFETVGHNQPFTVVVKSFERAMVFNTPIGLSWFDYDSSSSESP